MTQEYREAADRLNLLRRQYSEYVKEHSLLDQEAQFDAAYMRWECEMLLKQVEKKPKSSGGFRRAWDIVCALPWLLRHESLTDLISRRELNGSMIWEEEEVSYKLYTQGHADPEKAKEIWFIVADRLALVMKQDNALFHERAMIIFSPLLRSDAKLFRKIISGIRENRQ